MTGIDLSGLKHVRPFAPEPMGDVVPGGCGGCDAKWRGANFCHCATCHLTFRSVHGFDQHRDWRGDGRCRTAEELRKRGFEPDAEGTWRRPQTEPIEWNKEKTDG